MLKLETSETVFRNPSPSGECAIEDEAFQAGHASENHAQRIVNYEEGFEAGGGETTCEHQSTQTPQHER
jgi:hypothetical protein